MDYLDGFHRLHLPLNMDNSTLHFAKFGDLGSLLAPVFESMASLVPGSWIGIGSYISSMSNEAGFAVGVGFYLLIGLGLLKFSVGRQRLIPARRMKNTKRS